MNAPKRWWQSKTVLGALAALIATGVRSIAPELGIEEGAVLSFLTQATQTAGMIVAIVGRFKADRPVVTKATETRLKIAAAQDREASAWMQKGTILRVGIADEDIKLGSAVSIDEAGKVKVFREPRR